MLLFLLRNEPDMVLQSPDATKTQRGIGHGNSKRRRAIWLKIGD
ncbi:hypothetical protein [Pseudogulbenkiania sp. NH8B]|nr:hypothetical protein [Pseudogulbenkiania sp. NH8B]